MIGPCLVSILANPFNDMCWLRESLGPYDRLLKSTIISERGKKRRRVAARSSVGKISCSDQRLREPECAFWS